MNKQIKVGSKVKVVDVSGCKRIYEGKLGQIFTVTKIMDENTSQAIYYTDAGDGSGGMFNERFELVEGHTTLPSVFTFRTSSGVYRMTLMASGEYACTMENEVPAEGVEYARYPAECILNYINDGTWTFDKDITPLPRQFTVRASNMYDYDVDLDAQTMSHVDSGQVYKDSVYTDEFAKATIAEGTWVVIRSKAEREAEAKALADTEAAEKDARKDAVVEAAKAMNDALEAYKAAAAALAAAVAAL